MGAQYIYICRAVSAAILRPSVQCTSAALHLPAREGPLEFFDDEKEDDADHLYNQAMREGVNASDLVESAPGFLFCQCLSLFIEMLSWLLSWMLSK